MMIALLTCRCFAYAHTGHGLRNKLDGASCNVASRERYTTRASHALLHYIEIVFQKPRTDAHRDNTNLNSCCGRIANLDGQILECRLEKGRYYTVLPERGPRFTLGGVLADDLLIK